MSLDTRNFSGPIKVGSLVADPSNPHEGLIYYNTTTGKLRVYVNGAFQDSATVADIGGTYRVNLFTLSPTDISNGYVTLTDTPSVASDTILNIVGGVVQDYSTDFTVSGSTLSWSGLGLDGVLSSGDKLIVQFN